MALWERSTAKNCSTTPTKACTQLAILEHNHVGRTQAQTKEGAKKHKFVSPEGSQGWVAKPQYEEKSYQFLEDLMTGVLAFKRGHVEVPPLPLRPAAADTAPTARPAKEGLIDKHRSCFHSAN